MDFRNNQVQHLFATLKGYFSFTWYVCHGFSLLDTQAEGEAPMWHTGFLKSNEESDGGSHNGSSSFFLEEAYVTSTNISLDKASLVAKPDIFG